MKTDSLYTNVTTELKLHGKAIKVHALCTGTVAVKRTFRTQKGFGPLSKLNILLDSKYTDYLPIWVYVIEHPDGLIVVDTGENAGINHIDNYLSKESAIDRFQFKHAAKFDISESDELKHQFEKVGLRVENVKLVVLTHLHLDHTDGLKFFPKQEIVIGALEFNRPTFNMDSTYPTWFKPRKVDYLNKIIDIFDYAYPLSTFGNLYYIPTPGHTHGNSSLIFRTDDYDLFFAGDCSYNQDQLISGELAGVHTNFRQSKETYQKILAYGSQHKLIYLPTHDEQAGIRLQNKIFLI